MLLFKNMIFNKYTLIYVSSSTLKMHICGQEELELSKGTLFIVGKKSKIVGLSNNIYKRDIISIDDDDVESIIKFLPAKDVHHKNNIQPLMVGPRLLKEERLAFRLLKTETSKFRRISILMFIFSRMETRTLASFFRSSKPISLISSRISTIVEGDLSFPWKMHDVAKELHTSVSTLRRKLKEENYTFTQILLDIKMKNALRLIDCSTGNIGSIASALGYKSEAYFIAVFKKYYDITPKQFYLRNRRLGCTCHVC